MITEEVGRMIPDRTESGSPTRAHQTDVRYVIQTFANGWTIIVNVYIGGDQARYEYMATSMAELMGIIECVAAGNYGMDEDDEGSNLEL